ncbi:D-alanyl-lipoteichoic acid biosynthesis protein DltD [Bizionia psychrotolerans]|uniref:D-alanyl-lipoteichoic acid biosynthesis protein DltD n=1 Tax=Bizionia psychrotolerans TaxID=1492901 RepID=UPI0006520EDC|nr:hypothetical protein [Bizionia psychrotolerans]
MKGEYDGVVLGNSHAYRNVIVENLQFDCINLANVSQSIDIDYKWFEKALEHNNLKFVIVNVSLPTLLLRLNDSKEQWRTSYYNIYTDLRLNFKVKDNLELLNKSPKDNFKKLQDYFLQPNNFKVTCLSKGSYPLDITLENFEENAIKTSNRHLSFGFKHFQENRRALQSIINKALEGNIKVLILIPPMHKDYRNLIDKKYSEKLFNTIELIVKERNIQYLNYYEDVEFENYMFKDSDHLNIYGAELLTRKINIKLIELL